MDIENHPAWKLIPEYSLDYGQAGKDRKYFYVATAKQNWEYCIDYMCDSDIRIEVFRGNWIPLYEGFKSPEEALQVLATLIATDTIKP